MFKPLPETEAVAAAASAPVDITIDGVACQARVCDTAASALLLAGVTVFRTTPVRGSPRAPYCMAGSCFECLVTVDGVSNQRACCIAVRPGMRLDTQVTPR